MKPPQELFLDLIESAGKWNAFDGPSIAEALRANRKLWRAVVLTDAGGDLRVNEEGIIAGIDPPLGVLRSLLDGFLAYDVIRAIPAAGQDEALKQLFDAMHADSVRWLSLRMQRVLLVGPRETSSLPTVMIRNTPSWKHGGTEASNQAPAPHRHPRVPFGAAGAFVYQFCAPPACSSGGR